MPLRLAFAFLGLILVGCGGASAPDQAAAPPPSPAIASEADPRLETYKPEEWPEASPLRDGVAVTALTVSGWRRSSLDIDPRLAQAQLAFAPSEPEAESRLFARVRLHDKAEDAREDLLARMRAATATLQVIQGLGDIAYAAQSPAGLSFVAAARGNICFSVRAPELDAEALELAQSIDQQIQQSPAVAALSDNTAPRFAGAELRQAETGRSRPLGLSFAPNAPQPAALAFDCSQVTAGVVLGPQGAAFSSAKAGIINIRGHACTDRLRRSQFSLNITVKASSIDAAFDRAADRDRRFSNPRNTRLQSLNPNTIKLRETLKLKKVDLSKKPGGN